MNETASTQKVPIVCKVDDLSTTGWVERRDLPQGERFQRAAKIFMVFLAAAFLTVFVPVLHFVLPPLSLLIGATLALNEYAGTGEVVNGEVTCPNCKNKMSLPVETETWPRVQRCSGCSFSLTIDREK
jgi:hypothetical protein